ncbi:hypothetical protein EUX98_g6025 [Antrodiella citrinella]|uniref:Uncharacterized protein n=1 Tax=Antrodiella citrinella TaxID=2447956 RepID=A0A4S4MSM0_9APHY|nr:hypothetical protein EUX98_g6025 [Antrodiella citrinella]
MHPKNTGWNSSVNNINQVSAKGSHGSSGTGKKHMKILNHLSAILARGRGGNPDSVVAVSGFDPELSSGDNHLTVVESVRNMETDDAAEMQAPAEDPSLASSRPQLSSLKPSSLFVSRNPYKKLFDGATVDKVTINAKANISTVEMLYKDADAKIDIHRYKALVSPNEVRELEDESVTLDSDLDSHIDDFPEPCRQFMRTFASFTVIYFGTEFLLKRTIFRSEVPFTVHMISLKSPVVEQSDLSSEVTKVIGMWETAGLIKKT